MSQFSDADRALIQFALEAEQAAHGLYSAAAASAVGKGEAGPAVALMRDHHRAYAQALNGLYGEGASTQRSAAVIEAFADRVADPSASLDALRELENVLAATHTALVGRLESTDAAALVASIVTTEARHAAVLAELAGAGLDAALDAGTEPLAP
ncbi:MAG: ferritin-like domain-containing protein [Acidimicrobiia bacterium]